MVFAREFVTQHPRQGSTLAEMTNPRRAPPKTNAAPLKMESTGAAVLCFATSAGVSNGLAAVRTYTHRDTDTDTETQRHRDTETQTHRQTDTDADTDTDTDTDTDARTHTHTGVLDLTCSHCAKLGKVANVPDEKGEEDRCTANQAAH